MRLTFSLLLYRLYFQSQFFIHYISQNAFRRKDFLDATFVSLEKACCVMCSFWSN